jgi:ribosomal protein S12 methylthiotransferase accessory factor YcaO
MLSLAAYRYRNIRVEAGGPVARLQLADMMVLGRREFLATAFLREGLAGKQWQNTVFSVADGGGTASSPMVARFMAISEAMERWAHWQLHDGAEKQKYGFDADPSSNGMAAFPGLFRRQARPGALMEAAERFNLLHWWEGRLPASESDTPWAGVRAATICSEAPGITVILFQQVAGGFMAYGHGAAMNFAGACRKAAVEMERHAQIIARFARAHAGKLTEQLPPDAHPIERRSLFFATEAGHELFLERLRSTPRRALASPRLVFDGEVPGPWTRYADVWRVVYEPPSDRFLGPEENYFLW